MQEVYAAESKAHQRNLVFALKADQESYSQVARLFRAVARIFSFARDVEREHAKLYESALERMLADTDTDYYVCGICGYVSDGVLPDKCPICGATKQRFKHII